MYPRSHFFTSAATRFRVSHGGRGSRPEKNMLYSASSCLSPAARVNRSFCTSVSSGMTNVYSSQFAVCSLRSAVRSTSQEPNERQPEFPCIRNGSIVDQHVGCVEPADEAEEVAQVDGVLRVEPGAVAQPIAGAHLAVIGGRARHLQGPRVIGPREDGKLQSDGEWELGCAEQRFAQLGIERGELIVARLLRQIDVRPESFDRAIIRYRHARLVVVG